MYVVLTRRIYVEHGKVRDIILPDNIIATNIHNVEKFIKDLSCFENDRAKHTGHRKNYTVLHYFKLMLPKKWKNCHSSKLIKRIMCRKFNLKGLPYFASYEKKGKCKYLVVYISDRDCVDGKFSEKKRDTFQGTCRFKSLIAYVKEIVKTNYKKMGYVSEEIIKIAEKIDYTYLKSIEKTIAKRKNHFLESIEKLITTRYLELIKYFPNLFFDGAILMGEKYINQYGTRKNATIGYKKYRLYPKNKNELLMREFEEKLNNWTHIALQEC